ncbi:hypothetical protein H9Y04_01480 [Streptomyces sp. TRM66268-LWL]|uniref:ATP-grasp domain-containing protein n=1 Tax=Streptomyces polyasparticus TaxID=2767826 RepID=A0ABR7S6Y2_9ACTN|nr:hypothetical protein [Streptomyces polyasparticus]MBC9711241.1 hypothetical protein [Streptomyces polyasparticus]
MPPAKPRILYVTDLAYPARGRRYCDEDIALTARLREHFALALCHPLDATALLDGFDAAIVRNSGPVLNYLAEYEAFGHRTRTTGLPVYNTSDGRGDMAGKDYLVDLTDEGLAVIPTVAAADDLHRLPAADAYIVKPRLGADSLGLRTVAPDELATLPYEEGILVQPKIPFRYEVSFYFVDDAFQYALYAPDPERRWELVPYEPTAADLEFARSFIAWNTLSFGIQRVDACRAPDGALLLVELEDLNPYLSLDRVDEATREAFAAEMTASVHRLLDASDAR